jgi:hypothetical protein
MQKEAVMAHFEYYPSTCLKRSRKITKTSVGREQVFWPIFKPGTSQTPIKLRCLVQNREMY